MRLLGCRRLGVLAPVMLVLVTACGDDESGVPLAGLAPDFSLTDVNPNSPSSGQAASPRQHLGEISAWYFGHAT